MDVSTINPVATPAELIRRMNVPGLTIDFVIEKLQVSFCYNKGFKISMCDVEMAENLQSCCSF